MIESTISNLFGFAVKPWEEEGDGLNKLINEKRWCL